MAKLIRSLRSGQITIPADFREKLGITDETLFQISLAAGELRIKPVETTQTLSGSPWLSKLYEYFGDVRREAKRKKYSEAEINASIDGALAAVRAVREKHDQSGF